jgi:hypothetical protein
MSVGGIFGTFLQGLLHSYVWVYNINSILMFILFFVTAYVYPYDPPMAALASAVGGQAPSDISMSTLVKRFD